MQLYRGLDQTPKIHSSEELASLKKDWPRIAEALTDGKTKMFDEKGQIRPEFYQEIGEKTGFSGETVKEMMGLWGNSRPVLSFTDSKEMAFRYAGDEGYVITAEVDQQFATDHLGTFTLSMEGEAYLLTMEELADLQKTGRIEIKSVSEMKKEGGENVSETKPREFKPFRDFKM